MKKIGIYFLIVLTFLILVSCVNIKKPSNTDTSNNTSEIYILGEYDDVVLKIDLSKIVNSTSSYTTSNYTTETDTVFDTDYYLIYQNITSNEEATYVTVDSTELELPLATDSIYVIALAKDNGDHIETIGFLGEPSYGLICVPTPESGRLIDLGSLIIEETEEGTVLSSSVDPSKFANALDFDNEKLETFGMIDLMFKNLINPDTNRNGVLDIEEGLKWDIGIQNVVFSLGYFAINGWLKFSLSDECLIEIFGEIPDISNTATLTSDNDELAIKFLGVENYSDKVTWVFGVMPKPNILKYVSFSGRYELEVEINEDTEKFIFDDLRFFDPSNVNDGFVFPKLSVKTYSDGKIKEVDWNWKIQTGEMYPDIFEIAAGVFYDTINVEASITEFNNALKDVDPDIVKRVTYIGKHKGLEIQFLTKNGFIQGFNGDDEGYAYAPTEWISFCPVDRGYEYYENGSEDFSNEDKWISYDLIHADFDTLPKGFESGLSGFYDILPTPSNYTPNATPLSLTKDTLQGIWYNLFFFNEFYTSFEWLPYNDQGCLYFYLDENNNWMFTPAYWEFTPDGTVAVSMNFYYPYFSRHEFGDLGGVGNSIRPDILEGTYTILDNNRISVNLQYIKGSKERNDPLFEENTFEGEFNFEMEVKVYENGTMEIISADINNDENPDIENAIYSLLDLQ